jgi:hypothetical protein
MGDMPYDPELAKRQMIDWQSAQAMGNMPPPDDMTGRGIQFSGRPEEGMYQPQADIKAQSVDRLARGASNIPSQLGSNDPSSRMPQQYDPNAMQRSLAMMQMGAAMMQQGQGRQMQPKLAAPMGGEGWGSTYKPVTFQGKGVFQNASPYANGVPPFASASYKEALKKRMAEMQTVNPAGNYSRGLLD